MFPAVAGAWGALEPAGTCDFRFSQGRLLRMAVGWFYLSFYALCLLGLLCVILTIYWMQLWHGGFAWDGTIHMFNYHPVLMVVGLVVLYSAGEYPDFPGAGLGRRWLCGSGSGVGQAVSQPRCHLQEGVVRMGASGEGGFPLGLGVADFSCTGADGKGLAKHRTHVAAAHLCSRSVSSHG